MRLSHLLKQGGDALGKRPAQPQAQEPVEQPMPASQPRSAIDEELDAFAQQTGDGLVAPPAPEPAATPLPDPPEAPLAAVAPLGSPQPQANPGVYESIPKAIYDAAGELHIPIPRSTDQTLDHVKTSLLHVFERATDASDDLAGLWQVTSDLAKDLATLIALHANFARMLHRHAEQKDQLVWHCINTSLLAMDLAKEIPKLEGSAQDIGAAGLLCDIGMASAKKPSWDETSNLFKQHVQASVEILGKMKVPEVVKTIVAQHHERVDGAGLPAQVSGTDMLLSSQVLSLAEGFERIVNIDNGGSGRSGDGDENYMQTALAKYRQAFRSDILKAFISLRGFYPDGTMVELTNRAICVVVRQNEGFPLRPVVQMVMDGAGNHCETATIIDLRAATTLSVMHTVAQTT